MLSTLLASQIPREELFLHSYNIPGPQHAAGRRFLKPEAPMADHFHPVPGGQGQVSSPRHKAHLSPRREWTLSWLPEARATLPVAVLSRGE